MTPSPQPPRFSRRAKLIIGGAVAIITVLYIFACALLIDTFVQRSSPAVVGPIELSPTPSVVAPTPLIDQPQVAPPSAAVSANPIVPAAPLTVVGSNWVPHETVTILLRDPAQPTDPLLLLGTAQADDKGLVVVTVTYPAEPRWAELNQADVIIQSQTTNIYAAVSITVQPIPATSVSSLVPTRAPPTMTPTFVPTRVPPVIPSSTPVWWTVTPTRVPPTVTPTRTPTGTPTPPAFPDWYGEYFANPMLLGAPMMVRNDPNVNINWGRGAPAPGMPVDNFSVRWTRQLSFPITQPYRFVLRSDDGVRLWIDGVLIIDAWHMATGTPFTRDVNLTAGWHAFRIEYYEGSGDAYVQFRIENVPQTFPDWKGDYFSNKNLSGLPALTRIDVAVSFDWGQGAPANGLPVDGFSVRWTRALQYDAGVYRFSLRSDDGVRLWIDGILQIDEWHDASGQTYAPDVQLGAGTHAFTIEYFENTGGALIYFTVQRTGDITKWKGEYFPNVSWAGSPALIRDDDHLDFDWGAGSPDQLIPPDRFSVRWTRSIDLDAGTYRFDLIVDDGVRFWIDNVLVLDKVQVANTTYSIAATLTAGKHTFRLDYVEFTGNARFSWTRTFLGGPTATATATATVTLTPTRTVTRTPTWAPTWTPTVTNLPPTFTPTHTPTATVTSTPTSTFTPLPTAPAKPTVTPIETPTTTATLIP